MTTETNTPSSLVCPHCKKETGITKELVMDCSVVGDVYCPHCKKLMFSSKPEVETYTYSSWTDYSNYAD